MHITATALAAYSLAQLPGSTRGIRKRSSRAQQRAGISGFHMFVMQASEAYEQHMAKQTALAYAERDRYRAELEAAMSPNRQQRVLEAAERLIAQCITLTGAPCYCIQSALRSVCSLHTPSRL